MHCSYFKICTENRRYTKCTDNGKKATIKQVALDLTWDDTKLGKLWDRCDASDKISTMNQKETTLPFKVDPRLALAIICCEGTGSFDSNYQVR